MRDSFKAYAKKLGIRIVMESILDPISPNYTECVENAKRGMRERKSRENNACSICTGIRDICRAPQRRRSFARGCSSRHVKNKRAISK